MSELNKHDGPKRGRNEEDAASLRMDISEYVSRAQESDSFNCEYYPGAERSHYEFAAERRNMYTTNFIESISHLVKGCLGVGFLGLHESYMHGGLWTSLALTFVLGFLIYYSTLMIVRSAQKMYVRIRVPKLSYPDLAEAALATGPLKCCRRLSKVFRYIVDLCLIAEYSASCCVCEIIIASTLKQSLELVSPVVANLNLDIRLYILMITLLLIILCMITNLKYLAPFSILADVCIAVCVMCTLYHSVSLQSNIMDRPAWKSVQGMFKFCGVCIYTFEGIGIVLPIENNMKRPLDISFIIQVGMAIVTVFSGLVGFFGYWGWGEECKSPITLHMPLNTFQMVLRFLLIIMFAITYAVRFWVPSSIIWHYLGKKLERNRLMWERILRAVYVLVLTCISVAVPDVHILMSFLGDFLLTLVAFIFPAFIESLVTWREPGRIRWTLIKDIFIIIFGLILWCGAFVSFKE